jgi:predicted DCC family thiol-disulfide oxidoreductase YuxK
MGRVKVYYNSACPVCDAGIRAQKRKLEGSGAEVDWVDVHEDRAAAAEVGADLERVRERLHLVDETGALRVGAEAFLTLWRLTPRQGWLAALFGAPLLRGLFGRGYNAFAALLYRWNRRHARW